MPTAGKILQLQQILAERYPAASLPVAESFSTGVPLLDRLGGLPKAALTELCSPGPAQGSASLLQALIQAPRLHRITALIDAADAFEPPAAGELAHLLWVRCRRVSEAIKAADLLLRDGNVPLVLLDLWSSPAREVRAIPSSTWYRFHRVVEASAATLLVVTACRCVTSAQLRLTLASPWNLEALDLDLPALVAQLDLRITRQRVLSSSPSADLAEVG